AAGGGQDVIGAGDVVARGHGRERAAEDGAAVLETGGDALRIARVDGDVLGGDVVGGGHGLVDGIDHHVARGAHVERFPDGDADDGGVGAVLGLRVEVRLHQRGVGGVVGDDHQLGRPGGHVDPHLADQTHLRRGDVGV